MRYFHRMTSAIDPKPFLGEIVSLDDAWALSTGRQQKIKVQREALGIPLRGLRKSAINGRQRRDVHESRWTTASKNFPLACRFLSDFAEAQGSLLGRAKIVCLPAGRRVYPHVDRGDYYRVRHRYHFILRSSRGSWLKAGDEEIRMREGELWWFDNKQSHEAFNDGDQDRIHIIFDLLPRHRAEDVFRGAFKSPSTPKHGFTLHRQFATRPGALDCWLALPSDISTDAPPLIAIHGIRRGALTQAETFAERATMAGRPVIAPLFDTHGWNRYQQVVRGGRADLALLDLMAELREAGIWRTPTFELAGYSGGAQFAHRFAMLHPNLVARLTVVSSGWYTFPDDAAFPYGLARRPGNKDDWGPRLASRLDQFLRLPIQVCVGAEDNVADPNTRGGPAIERQQGKDRLTRATRWYEALRDAAIARGIDPRVALTVLPHCGHDFRECVHRGGLDRLLLPDAEPMTATHVDPEHGANASASAA